MVTSVFLSGSEFDSQRYSTAIPALLTAALCMQFCEQLRQPLCLALLRNCTSVFDEAFSAAARLFTAILLQPKLRSASPPV